MMSMSIPVVSGHIDAGQILNGLLLLGIGWGLRQVYLVVLGFVNDVHDNKSVLRDTTEIVDVHSETLISAGLLPNGSIKRLHLGRREGDPTYIVVEKDKLKDVQADV